jgi:hypothetical protein
MGGVDMTINTEEWQDVLYAILGPEVEEARRIMILCES